uniref:Integrase catalytic domain-containing protein n=1 Tax=Parascaris univalens TaxID=6257 RepID=A0A915CA11_PARUN
MRCLGRLEHAALPEETVHPVLLPKSSALTRLIVLARHNESGHAGVSQTLANMRKRYWIPQGRATVKRIFRRHCMACRRWNAKTLKLPAFPPLPKERTWATRASQNVGLYYMGPTTVRDLTGRCKKWIAFFTCLATRAIHSEATKNLSAEQFLHVLRRFIAKNAYPTGIVLDNAPQFQLVKQVMQNTLAAPITWQFITPFASWQGGIYERIVGLIKTAFRNAIGRRLLDEEEFKTLVVECDAIVNRCRLRLQKNFKASRLPPTTGDHSSTSAQSRR